MDQDGPMSPIEARGLTRRFSQVTAVDDVTFSVRSGEVTGFLGRNGAGKTTTLRMILGLERPISGAVTVDARSRGGPSPGDASASRKTSGSRTCCRRATRRNRSHPIRDHSGGVRASD